MLCREDEGGDGPPFCPPCWSHPAQRRSRSWFASFLQFYPFSAHPAGHTLFRKSPGVGLSPLCNFSSFLFPLPWLSLCRDSTTVSAGEPARARATGTGVGSDFLATPFPIKHRVLFCQPELKPCSREEPKAHPVVAQLCHRGHHELLAAPALPFASADLPPPTIKTIWEKGPCCWNSTHRISTAWRFFSTF